MLRIDNGDHRFEPAKCPVGPPFLRQFGGCPGYGALVITEACLEALQEAEGVGGRPGEPRQHLAIEEATDLPGVALHDDLAQGDLAIASEGRPVRGADCQNRRCSHPGHARTSRRQRIPLQGDPGIDPAVMIRRKCDRNPCKGFDHQE